MGFAAKDFASHDIGLVGQRLPSSVYAAGVPILYYYDKNFSKQTRDPIRASTRKSISSPCARPTTAC